MLHDENGAAVYTPPKVETEPHYVIGKLKFCSDPWSPYAGYADKPLQGYIVDVVRAIYEPLGYEIEYVNVPWSRCIRDARDGVFHALAGADIDEVPDFVFPTQPIGTTKPQFFIRHDFPWKFESIESLDNIRLGSIKDYTYSASLDTYIREHQSDKRMTIVTGVDALEQLITLLQAGRIDAFIENAPVVRFMLSKMDIETNQIKSAGTPGVGVLLYVPFSPKYQESRELVTIFDRGINQLRSNGQLNEILSTYQVEDWLRDAEKIEQYKISLED